MAEAAPEEPAAPPAPAENAPVAGVPEVIDTTTLRIGGEVLRLHGVEWARGGEAEDLRAYLAGREVACRPADQPERVRCEVGGRDLSVVVLYNGGAKATPDAPEELRVAERHAKARGAGVWKN
jgi:endonuclease YncB( thermonuclease family)